MLTRNELWKGCAYEIKSRNLIVGVYDGDEGFIGIREKFGDEYLFTEYLARELGGTKRPFDTVRPVAYMATLDEGIELVTTLGTACDTCGKRAWFVQDPQIQSGRTWGWWECEGRCFVIDEERTLPRAVPNQVLFDILRELEQPVRQRLAEEFPPIERLGKVPDAFTGLKGNHPMADEGGQ